MKKRYALLMISTANEDGTVNGVWLQNCAGCTLEEAIQRAIKTEKANSNRIDVAVVEENEFGVQDYSHKKRITRYDGSRFAK